MNKKIFMGSVLAGTMLLTSCGTPVELGTFEEEIQKEQASYAANVSEYVTSMDTYQSGKFTQTGTYSVDVNIPKTIVATISGAFSGDSILEKEVFALDMEMDVNAKATIDKNAEDIDPMALGAEGNAEVKFTFGMTNDMLYANVGKLMFDAKGTDDFDAAVKQGKAQFDVAKGMVVGKWFSLELPEELKSQLKKSFTMNVQVMSMMKEVSQMLVTGDMFTAAEKTTYEGQDAYKFSLDEEKAAKHFLSVLKVVSEKYSDVLEMYNVSKEDMDAMVARLEEQINDPETFAKPTLETEMYLTKAKDGGANIYVTKFAPIGKSDTQNVTLSIVENVLTVKFIDNTTVVNAKFEGKKGGKLVFSGDVKEGETQIGKIDGNYVGTEKSGAYISKATVNLEIPAQKEGMDPIAKNGMNVQLTVDGTTKKDDSVEITTESITNNAEEIIDLAPLLGGAMGSMMMGGSPYGDLDTASMDEEVMDAKGDKNIEEAILETKEPSQDEEAGENETKEEAPEKNTQEATAPVQ